MSEGTGDSPKSAEASSLLRRLVDTGLNPERLGADLAATEKTTWWAPLLLGVVITAGWAAAAASRIDFRSQYEEAMAKAGVTIPPDQLESMLDLQSRIGKWSMLIGAPLFVPLGVAAVAFMVWALSRWVMGGQGSYRLTFALCCYTQMLSQLKALLSLPGILSRSTVSPQSLDRLLPSSLAWFLPEEGIPGALLAALGSVDLFVLWGAWALAMGLHRVQGLSRGSALGVSGIIVLGGASMRALGSLAG